MSKGNWCIENDFAAQRELAYYTEEKLGKLCRISELEKQFIELQDHYSTLVEAVEWERETSRFWEFGRTRTLVANDEAMKSMFAARIEVDRILEETK